MAIAINILISIYDLEYCDEPENNFDGLATIINDKYPVIVINKNFNVERKRFTLLHELGHLLLELPECEIKYEESVCNRFASEFLFPINLVFKDSAITFQDLMNGDADDDTFAWGYEFLIKGLKIND